MTPRQPQPPLLVEVTQEAAVVRLGHRVLGGPAVESVRRHFAWLVRDSDRRELWLDLGGVEVPTAAGLGRLVALHKDLRAAGGGLVLGNVGGLAYEVFRLTGLTGLLDVRPKDGCAA